MYPRIVLHKGKEVSLLRKHPWVFSGAIKAKDDSIQEGDFAEVYSAGGLFLATGYYAGGSIAVRVVSFTPVEINADFWEQTIEKALSYRNSLNIINEQTNVYRLFFGEGDGVPALVIDNYNGHLVIQAHHIGVYRQRENIAEALKKVMGSKLKAIYDKSAETISGKKTEEISNGFLFGSENNTEVKENGFRFLVDWTKGQKTGFFIDQRENRKLLAQYCKGKSVLNTFAYTGGFSVYAMAAKASLVHSVDVSAPAMEICELNMKLNVAGTHEAFIADVFDFLKDKKQIYDVIVLDPPAFAKNRDARHQAVKGYKRLNALAIKQIKAGGILFTFSCSGVVDKYLFYNTVASAAMEAGRNVKILHYLNQPADHPVSPFFPEGEYLKGMVLWVE